MEFTDQKHFPGVLPEGGWSGLELTDHYPHVSKQRFSVNIDYSF